MRSTTQQPSGRIKHQSESTEASCLNCRTRVQGEFCHRCGQATTTGRLELGALLRQGLTHLFDVDAKVLRTVIGLTRNPGELCRQYVAGRRVGYVQPIRYFLTVIALTLVINIATGFDPGDLTSSSPSSRAQTEVREILGSFAIKHIDLAILFALPAFIFAVRLFFRKAGYSYAEVGVFVLFILGHCLFLGLPLAGFRVLAPAPLAIAKLGLQVGFFSWASIRFFDSSLVSSVFKNVLLTVIYMILIAISVLALTLPKLLPIFAAL